jgi:serine/threonine-protein kinase
MAATEPDLSDGAIVLGKLRVMRKLGRGGIGAVYEVEHELTKHRRALKVLHPKFRDDPDLVERFLREASAAGRIGSPHIVEAFDAGKLDDGSPWLLMELLQGEPLTEVLRREGRLDVGSACALLSQCCDAVAAAHGAGIVHRDLKPDNLFVVTRDGRPFVKVLDFGISKFDAEPGALGVTATGVALGTPLYMAPEQMRGAKNVDARADVYSLGVVLYESLAGGTPYGGDSFAELAAAALGGQAKPLHELRGEVPVALSQVVHRAIAVDREHRFATARDLGEALRPFAVIGAALSGDAGLDKTAARGVPQGTLATPAGVTKASPSAAPVVATQLPAPPPPMTPAPPTLAPPTALFSRRASRQTGPLRQGLRVVLIGVGFLFLGRTVWNEVRHMFVSESREHAQGGRGKAHDAVPPSDIAASPDPAASPQTADAGSAPKPR